MEKDTQVTFQVTPSAKLEATAFRRYVVHVKALQLPLAPEQRRSALLGLGSTYRCLGEYSAAVQTLEQGRAEFPQAQEFVPFLAMAWYNTGCTAEALELLLNCLVETSANEDILSYQRAILFYANKLDQTW